MKTFDEFITEGRKKEEQKNILRHAWELGRENSHMSTTASSYRSMTPKEVLNASGGGAIRRDLERRDRRREKSVKRIMKKYGNSLNEKVGLINYFGAKRHKVFQNGKEKIVPQGKAVPKRSSSSGSGCGS
jgi:hypothetical protein